MGNHGINICNIVKVLKLSGEKGKCFVEQQKETTYHGYFVEAKERKTGPAVIIHVDETHHRLLLTNNRLVLRWVEGKKYKVAPDSQFYCTVLYIIGDITIGYINERNQKTKNKGRLVQWSGSDVIVGQEATVVVLKTLKNKELLCRKHDVTSAGKESEIPVSTSLPFVRDDFSVRRKLVGTEVEVVVSEIFPTFALATIEGVQDGNEKPVFGRLHASELAVEPAHDSAAMTRIAVGQKLRCNVIEYRPDPSQPDQESNPLELSQRRKSAENSNKQHILIFSSKRNFRYPPGSKVTAYIASYSKLTRQFRAEISIDSWGVINDYLIADRTIKYFDPEFYVGKAMHCYVVNATNPLDLKAKGAIIDGDSGEDVDVMVTGSIITGRVEKVSATSLSVNTLMGTGTVHLCDVTDDFVDQPLSGYKIDQFVRCYVLKFIGPSICLSLKKSHTCVTKSRDLRAIKVSSLAEGELLQGYVTDFKQDYISVAISRRMSVQIAIDKLPDRPDTLEDLIAYYPPGTLVECCVISYCDDNGPKCDPVMERWSSASGLNKIMNYNVVTAKPLQYQLEQQTLL